MSHSWSGNVRELRNVVEFAIALADGPIVLAEDVSEALGSSRSLLPGACPPARERLVSVLECCGWNTALAAERLGVHRSNVYRMMARLGIAGPRRRHIPGSGFGLGRASAHLPGEVA
jgi:transcriptional regulator of acetoin/glycerol metabolism